MQRLLATANLLRRIRYAALMGEWQDVSMYASQVLLTFYTSFERLRPIY
jgi:hypothetical protein